MKDFASFRKSFLLPFTLLAGFAPTLWSQTDTADHKSRALQFSPQVYAGFTGLFHLSQSTGPYFQADRKERIFSAFNQPETKEILGRSLGGTISLPGGKEILLSDPQVRSGHAWGARMGVYLSPFFELNVSASRSSGKARSGFPLVLEQTPSSGGSTMPTVSTISGEYRADWNQWSTGVDAIRYFHSGSFRLGIGGGIYAGFYSRFNEEAQVANTIVPITTTSPRTRVGIHLFPTFSFHPSNSVFIRAEIGKAFERKAGNMPGRDFSTGITVGLTLSKRKPVLPSDPVAIFFPNFTTKEELESCACGSATLSQRNKPSTDHLTTPAGEQDVEYAPEPSDAQPSKGDQPLDLNPDLIAEGRAHWQRIKEQAAERKRNEQFRERALELAGQSEGWRRERWLQIAEHPEEWEIVPPSQSEISMSGRPWNAEHQQAIEEGLAEEQAALRILRYHLNMARYANEYTRAALCFGRVNSLWELRDWLNKVNLFTLRFLADRVEYEKLAQNHLSEMAYADSDDARTFMKWIADNAIEHRMGCCNEHAAVAAIFLAEYDVPCMVVGSSGNKHAFVVIGTTKGNVKDWKNVVICDPYYNKVFVADAESFRKHYPDYKLRVSQIAIYK